jgi:hypothetical protein
MMEIIEHACMVHSKPCTTPVDTSVKLFCESGNLDISYAIQQVYLHMHDHRELHMTALKHILCYLQGALSFVLHL